MFTLCGEAKISCVEYIIGNNWGEHQSTHSYLYNDIQKENLIGKATDIAQAISEQIAQICNCEYSENFINNGKFFCSSSKKEIIYQARLLTTDGKTAEEIRNLTQTWVLTKPFVNISDQRHQLDPYCSVVIQEIGDLSCDPTVPTVLSSSVKSRTRGHLVAYSVGILLLLGIIIVTILVAFYAVKKHRSKKVKDATRYVI